MTSQPPMLHCHPPSIPSIARRAGLALVAAAVVVITSGCSIATIIAAILIASNSDDTNATPSVVIGSIARSTGQVAIPVTAVDADGDTLTLTVEFDAGGGFAPATVTPTSVSSSSAGTVHLLTWDAPADLGSSAYASGLRIRITPGDGTTTGAATTSDSFDFGNDPPVVTVVSVDADGQGKVAGDAVVRFTVTDSAGDSVQVSAFEYSETGDFSDTVAVALNTGPGENFPAGALANLASSPGGENHSFTWDSFLTAPVSASGVRIRLSVADSFGGDSGFEPSQAFDLANSTFVEITNPITRTTGDVPVVLTVFNTSDLMVTLTAEYSTDGGNNYLPATTTPAQIQGTSAGNAGTLQWDAAGDLGSTAYLSGLLLRVTPDDGFSTGPQETSDPFDFGNDAPVVQSGSVTIDTVGGVASGNVVIRFALTDSAADMVDIVAFEFSLAGDFSDATDVPLTTGSDGNFPSGQLTDLQTSAAGIEHAITWNSALLAPVDNATTRVRLMVRDTFSADSAFEQSPEFTLDNETNNPPVAQLAAVKPEDRAGIRAGAIWIDYSLIDPDGDVCDVRFEYSTDNKFSWNSCAEYPAPESEGRYDLTATSAGIVHRFVWDAANDLVGFEPSLHLRLTPAAQDGIGVAAETTIELTGGMDGAGPLLAPGDDFVTQSTSSDVAVGDFNRDGHPDLAVVNQGAQTVSVLEGRGDGSFRPATNIAVTGSPRHAAVADINGDGLLDLVVTRFTTDDLAILTGVGDGTFNAPSTLGLGGPFEPIGIVIADFTGDGIPDLMVSARDTDLLLFTTGRAVLLAGNGDGTFQAAVATTIDHRPLRMAIGDYNEDGSLDLAVACRNDDRVQVLINDGSGAFPTIRDVNVNDTPEDVTTGYFDNDSHLDLAIVNTRSNTQQVSVCLGNGDGTFQGQTVIDPGHTEPRAVVAADFTNDGQLDLATIHNTDQFALLAGDGAGSFTASGSVTCGTGAQALATGDFNGDGSLDVAVARSGGTVAVLAGRVASDSWFRDMVAFNPGDGSGNTVGTTTAPGGNDLFGSPRVNRFAVRRFHGIGDDRPDDRRSGSVALANDFLHHLRLAGVTPAPPVMEPLTRPHTVGGDLRLLRVPDPGSTDTGYRIEPVARLGDRVTPDSTTDLRRAGLDLSAAAFADQRGIIVDLPFTTTRSGSDITTALAADRLRVYLRQTDWLRASDVAADPLNGEAGADRYLPRLDIGGGRFRDLYVERHSFVRIQPAPNNNLDEGTGPRFVIDTASSRVRVLLEQGGTVQGYFIEP